MKLNFPPFLSGALLLGFILLHAPRQAESCGPEFPNHILGTSKWRSAPYLNFQRELVGLGLIETEASPEEYDGPESNEENDLKLALNKSGSEDQTKILESYKKLRIEITNIHANEESLYYGEEKPTIDPGEKESKKEELHARIKTLQNDGLPEEFALYLTGALFWRGDEEAAARKAWEAILDLLPAERKYRSTWAAFMLGRAYRDSNPDKAWKQFETVERLVAAGFADSGDLIHATHGWMGYIALQQKEFGKAFDYYIKQKGTGTSLESLRITAAKALDTGSGKDLEKLAANPRWLGIITAFLLSTGPRFQSAEDGEVADRLGNWVTALESADITEDQMAERIALAAYQDGDMAGAKRWANLAARTTLSRWILAKLALYDGDLEQAASILAPLSKEFPTQPEHPGPHASLASATMIESDNGWQTFSGLEQVWAERGVVELAREQYVTALNCFIQARFWLDAAYVAERVLTVDELRTYVDENSEQLQSAGNPTIKALRNLLGRRLNRSNKAASAEPYFDQELAGHQGRLVKQLQLGYDNTLPRMERASALFQAARIAREHGMELLGTELEPDWAETGGQYEWSPFKEIRNEGEDEFLHASAGEKKRVEQSELPFSRRFHYRYVASELAWIAASFMPDHHDETASMLCLGGTWLKYRDPEYADRFYKALVKRCRKTAMGTKADAMRWFPLVDAEGKLIEPEEKPEESAVVE